MSSSRPAKLAPVVATVLLGALLAWNETERRTGGDVGAYMAEARERIRAVPISFDSYFGEDRKIADSAVGLLKPNEILQRRYINTSDVGPATFSLLIVHCGLANDLNGHYPPICYPASGWEIERHEGAEAEDVVVHAGDIDIPAKRYRMRFESGAVPQRTDILSFFVVPTGSARFGGDIRLVDMASRQPATAKLGAAQVQILTPADTPEEERRELWERVVTELTPVLTQIAEGA